MDNEKEQEKEIKKRCVSMMRSLCKHVKNRIRLPSRDTEVFKLQIEYGFYPKKVLIYNKNRSVYGEVPLSKLPVRVRSVLRDKRKIYMVGSIDKDGMLMIEPEWGLINGRW